KLALLVLALVAGLLFFSWGVKLTHSLFTPWKIQTNIHKKYLWNGEFNLNLLVRTDKTSILTLNPKEEKVIIVNIPDETFLEVPYGFGSWQLRAIYELGESQKHLGGYKLLADTLTNFLAIPIDGSLDLQSLSPQKTTVEIVDTLRKNPFSMFNLLSDLKTDLTMWELLQLDFQLSKVRFDKVIELNLDKLGALDRGSLPDGTFIFTGDPVKLDSVLSDLADPVIVEEHKTIAVFNGTGKGQLADKWARLIRNLGGNVIITGNGEETDKTKVTGEKSATLKRLQQVFGRGDTKDSPETSYSRAHINLLLGEDYVNK
ncbi:MAG: LCP family protein, partial [Patescibacteria group bacterium]